MGERESDLALVRQVQEGNKKAFDVLVAKYHSKIISVSLRYVKDEHTAQDVAQDAFIKAYKGIKNFRGDSAFYTWLYRIAINTAKNHLTAMSRRIPLTDIAADEAEQYGSGTLLQSMDTPESAMLTDAIKEKIVAVFDALPDDLREAINLREAEGLSYEEIAEIMDCPLGTVRSRIFRAREAINEEIGPLLSH